jgi:Zn-dependent metalloprotease
MSNAFLLPKGTNNNRVVAPGSEDLVGPLGERARFFLVGLRPGTSFELGSTFRPALQIDPMVPASIEFTLTYPDGRRETATGVGDAFGSFAGPAAWPLDVPGIYRYQVRGRWSGFEARMPGLPEAGGHFFVYSKTKPAGAAGLRIDGASQRTFAAATGTTISGTSSAATVHYTLITPGAVIEQGEIPVKGGRFSYAFSPAAVNAKVRIYDIRSVTTGQPQLGRVLHLTFFAEEKAGAGSFFDVARVILRGATAISARGAIPVSAAVSSAMPSGAASPSGVEVGSAATATTTRVRLAAGGADPDFLRAWDEELRALERDGGLRLLSTQPDTLVAGRVHERLQQHYGGVPVYGGDVARQTANGETVSLFGVLHRVQGLNTVPVIGERAAGAAIERHTGGRIAADRPIALTVLPLDGGGYALAWMAEARTGTDVILCFLDAATGGVLRRHSVFKAQAPRSIQGVVVLDARGDAARAAAIVSGAVAPADGDLARQDARGGGAEADTAACVTAALQFFETRFGRRGLDGRGTPVTALVHAVRPDAWHGAAAGWRPFFAGGFWDGHRVIVGAGVPEGVTVDGLRWTSASRALDLISHELAHGVMDASWRPVYRGEAGALSEAFADMMGTAVEFAAGADAANYLLAEDATGGTGVRSLRQPSLHGLADHYDRRVATEDDNGGVHANATIAGHVYYLAIEGGTHATSGLAVEGVGRGRRDQVERAFYRAFVWMLPSDAAFADARAATIQSARDLYGPGSAAERAIADAWTAVGVR